MGDGEHPDMNVEEGHLGGYIRGRQSASPTTCGFEHGDPATWYPTLWRWACEGLGVRSVLDVGCGEGHAAARFRELGCRVLGVDGSRQARRDSVVPDRHVVHDYTHGPFVPDDDFDLVWSCEFVEHVEARYLDHFLATFRSATRFLMMTFAPPGWPGHHHVNCQPAEYWIDQLDRIGFEHDEKLTRMSRALAGAGHYHQRGIFFLRR